MTATPTEVTAAPRTTAGTPAPTGPARPTARTYRRILRRETHSPRSTLAITLAVLLILVLAYVGTESVLRVLDRPPLLVDPAAAADAAVGASALPVAILATAGAVLALVGLALVVASVTPGRLAKHSFTTDRSAVVMDNEVIASALARRAAQAARVDPDNASVSVTHRRAQVTLTPASGFPVDDAAVRAVADEEITRIAAIPPLRAQVLVASSGRVGS